jgi:hypothetical protein
MKGEGKAEGRIGRLIAKIVSLFSACSRWSSCACQNPGNLRPGARRILALEN